MFDQTNHHHNGETVDIADIKLEKNEKFQEMSAIVDGEKVWFRFPLFVELEVRAELFLPPAMIGLLMISLFLIGYRGVITKSRDF